MSWNAFDVAGCVAKFERGSSQDSVVVVLPILVSPASVQSHFPAASCPLCSHVVLLIISSLALPGTSRCGRRGMAGRRHGRVALEQCCNLHFLIAGQRSHTVRWFLVSASCSRIRTETQNGHLLM